MSFEQPIIYQILLTKKTPDYCISKEKPVSHYKHVQHPPNRLKQELRIKLLSIFAV